MKFWPWIYLLVAFLEITAEIFNFSALRFVSKPLLMPILMLGFMYEIKFRLRHPGQVLLAALLFAWSGDVLLMFQDKTPLAFLGGLASFLTTHILYAACFLFELRESKNKSILRKKPYLILIFAIYGFILVKLIFPGLAEMTLPVMIYASVIMLMCILAMNRYTQTSLTSFQIVFSGALSFMLSDSIIALNKFTNFFEGYHQLASVLIMVLYIAGQYLIVKGILAHNREHSPTYAHPS